MNEDIYLNEVAKMGRPIPGQSLTSDPDNPAPYEQAPKFTDVHEASMYLWDFITADERYANLMIGVSKGVPIMTLVEVILFEQFQDGMFNPDLMIMLAEPLAYMLIALAERLDLDIKIDNEEEEGDVFGLEMREGKINELKETAAQKGMIANQTVITEEMAADMQNLPEVDSLLAQPEVEMVEQQPSLMAQPEG